MAPSLEAKTTFGRDLEALGATAITPTDAFTLRVTFNDTVRGVTAANLVQDTLRGAKLAIELPLTGIPYNMTNTDVRDALRALPGVTAVYDGTPVDQPTFGVMAATKADAARLTALLRNEVVLQTRGGYTPHAINVTYGPVVETMPAVLPAPVAG
jgi:hypothetical protein